jgi:hypothetical protein
MLNAETAAALPPGYAYSHEPETKTSAPRRGTPDGRVRNAAVDLQLDGQAGLVDHPAQPGDLLLGRGR